MVQWDTKWKLENIRDMDTVCYQVPQSPSRKCHNCVWASVVQLVAINLREIESVKTEKFKFELGKYLDRIPDEPIIPNRVTAARSNSIVGQLSHLGLNEFIKVIESLIIKTQI